MTLFPRQQRGRTWLQRALKMIAAHPHRIYIYIYFLNQYAQYSFFDVAPWKQNGWLESFRTCYCKKIYIYYQGQQVWHICLETMTASNAMAALISGDDPWEFRTRYVDFQESFLFTKATVKADDFAIGLWLTHRGRAWLLEYNNSQHFCYLQSAGSGTKPAPLCPSGSDPCCQQAPLCWLLWGLSCRQYEPRK